MGLANFIGGGLPPGLCRALAKEFRKWASGRFHPAGPIRIIGKQVLDELDHDRTRHTEKDRATNEALGA